MTRLLPSHSLNAWHGSLDGRVHLSPFVSLPLSPVVSQPGCLARLSGWTGLFVSLCLPSFVSRCLPAWMPGTKWTGSFASLCPSLDAWYGSLGGRVYLSPLSPFICLPLSPSLDAWHWVGGFICLPLSQPGCLARLSGGRVHLSPFVSLHLSPVVSQPSLVPGTALWVDVFICLPLSPFVFVFSVCLPFSGCVCLPVSRPGCLAQLSKRSQPGCLPFICVPSFASMLVVAWHGFLGGGFILPLSPFICLLLSPSLDAWHGFVSGRIHLSPFFHFISPRLPAWMPGTALSQPGCLAMIVCSWCVPADHIGAFQVNTFFGNVGFQELARVAAMGFVWLSRV